MIGFDRPLKPRWIHETLQLWRPGTPLRDFYKDFNQIVYELSGKEGKRKVRTVLFRYFFDFEGHAQNQITTRESPLASVSRQASLDELKPAYLIVLLDRSMILQEILRNLVRLFPFGKTIITKQLIDNTVQLHGERDVVKRSTRSFLMTLVHFGILKKQTKNYEWNERLACSIRGLAYALIFFCLDNGRVEIDSRELRQKLQFGLLDISTIDDCMKWYNGILWSYIRRPLTAKIVLLQSARKKIISI